MRQIELADEQEFTVVQGFYWKLIDEMQGSPYLPGWTKGIYPADDYLMQSLKKQELYVLRENGRIAAAMVLNHDCNEGYEGTSWQADTPAEEAMVIHALGVLPEFHRRGFARSMVREAIRLAKERNQKAIRLDVLDGNNPALKLYGEMGFQYRRTARMFYEDTGWTDYLLFELVL